MIQEDYVSFEVAKLLNGKGFNEHNIRYGYNEYGKVCEPVVGWEKVEPFYLCPTHQMAMKWLREVHYLLVEIGINNLGYWYIVDDIINKDENLIPITKANYEGYKTYEEAVEEALKDALENMI